MNNNMEKKQRKKEIKKIERKQKIAKQNINITSVFSFV